MDKCARCGIAFKPVFEHFTEGQYDNVLWIQFDGGYGEFVDIVSEEDMNRYRIAICHDCAHQFCDDNPWIENVIMPHNSHSHTKEYYKANPNHYGWDYNARKTRSCM